MIELENKYTFISQITFKRLFQSFHDKNETYSTGA